MLEWGRDNASQVSCFFETGRCIQVILSTPPILSIMFCVVFILSAWRGGQPKSNHFRPHVRERWHSRTWGRKWLNSFVLLILQSHVVVDNPASRLLRGRELRGCRVLTLLRLGSPKARAVLERFDYYRYRWYSLAVDEPQKLYCIQAEEPNPEWKRAAARTRRTKVNKLCFIVVVVWFSAESSFISNSYWNSWSSTLKLKLNQLIQLGSHWKTFVEL